MRLARTIRWGLVRLARPQILFPLIALFLLAVIWGTTFSVISVKDTAAARAAAGSTGVLLDAYEAQAARTLVEIDQTLNLVKYWPHRISGSPLAELKRKGLLPPDLLFTVSIADRAGTIVDTTRPIGKRNVADQDYFLIQREHDRFFVGHLPKGLTGDVQLPFSRRLSAPDGAFDGIVIVSVDAAYFVSGYEKEELGEQGVLSLIGVDGMSRVRRTGDAVFSGYAIDYQRALQNLHGGNAGVASINSWDGVRRWTSAHEVYGYPLAVLVGLSVDEQMAPAHRQTRLYLLWAAVSSALVVLLTGLLGRMSWYLERSREMFRLMAESTNAIPFTLDLTHSCFTYIGAQAVVDSGMAESHWKVPGALDVVMPRAANQEIRQRFDECQVGRFEFMTPLSQRNGRRSEVRWTGTCEMVQGAKYLRGLMLDVSELRRLGRELTAAQKLESVGRLAAGVAHEINTPVQFVADNVQYVRTAMNDVAAVIRAYRGLKQAVQADGDAATAARLAGEAEAAADLDYFMENATPALSSSMEGLARIATIVRSMKEFAHPDQAQKAPADLNQAIRSTLVIAHNEYKYFAELSTEYGELPLIPCHLGEINQVVLNLIVNAAHTISDVVKDSGNMGRITVRTRLDGEAVEISIEDTGTGIPEAAREKIFDPFFTTKVVGKGTGQGLAIAHSVVVKKHAGTLRFETECGKGTTFFIRLPVGASTAELPEKVAA
jgi:signal transduction histidine kinase